MATTLPNPAAVPEQAAEDHRCVLRLLREVQDPRAQPLSRMLRQAMLVEALERATRACRTIQHAQMEALTGAEAARLSGWLGRLYRLAETAELLYAVERDQESGRAR